VSLDVNKLYNGFVTWFETPQSVITYAQAEAKMASVYHVYAQDAEDVSGERLENASERPFRDQLAFQRSQTARQFADQLDAAFVAYWQDLTFPTLVVPPADPPCPNVGGTGEFSVETAAVVSEVSPRAMYDAVLPVLTTSDEPARLKARKLADAMDRVTKSAVTVLITGEDTTTPTPVAITNTCTVF